MRYIVAFVGLIMSAGAFSSDLVDDFGASNGGVNSRMPGSGFTLKQIQGAFDTARTTENVQVFQFDRKDAPRLRLREYMETLIVLPKGETIVTYSVGDKSNFTVTPLDAESSNIVRVRPTYAGADTNLSLIGKSGKIYPFYMRVDSFESEHMPMFVVYVEADQNARMLAALSAPATPAADSAVAPAAKKKTPEELEGEYLRSIANVDVTAVNCSYETSSGKWLFRNAKWFGRSASKDLKPVRICDDGRWTYFRFSNEDNLDTTEQLPVVYQVVDGFDTPVNMRVEGGVIIAESTAKNWTLRAGDKHLCVRKL